MSGASQQQGGEEADRAPADNRDISHVNPPLPASPRLVRAETPRSLDVDKIVQ